MGNLPNISGTTVRTKGGRLIENVLIMTDLGQDKTRLLYDRHDVK